VGTRRLNARLDEELAKKVRFIKRRTSQSDTELVKASIELYYEKLRHESATAPADTLAEFIGCAEGERGLSARYKELLGPTLGRKL
jgi:hypothetical protein